VTSKRRNPKRWAAQRPISKGLEQFVAFIRLKSGLGQASCENGRPDLEKPGNAVKTCPKPQSFGLPGLESILFWTAV
jgi:hypothetical protein